MFEKLLPVLALAPFGIWLLPRWRQVIWGVLILLVYEGALRKWILPSYQAEIYLAKDALLLVAYLGYMIFPPPRTNLPKASRPVALFLAAIAVFLTLQLANPNAPSVFVSVLGLKNYLLYMPLCLVIPSMIESREDLEKLIRRYTIIVLPAVLINYVQFAMPPTHWINAYVDQGDDGTRIVSQFGSGDVKLARTAGMFSYLSGNLTFLSLMFLISLGQVVARGFEIKRNQFWIAVFIIIVGAMMTTGSRTALVTVAIGIIALCTFAVARRMVNGDFLVRMLILVPLAVLALDLVASTQFTAIVDRASTVSDTNTRLLSPFVETGMAFAGSPLYGTGMASTHGGIVPLVLGEYATFEWLNGVLVEVEPARIMQELGPFGFALIFAWRILFVILACRWAFRFRHRPAASFAAVCALWFAFHLVLFIAGNPTAAVYYYAGMGILLALIRFHERDSAVPVRRPVRQIAPSMRRLAWQRQGRGPRSRVSPR